MDINLRIEVKELIEDLKHLKGENPILFNYSNPLLSRSLKVLEEVIKEEENDKNKK